MSVLEQIEIDVREAMKRGEKERLSALRLLLSELRKAEKDGGGDELALLRRERKRRLEAASAYSEGGREDLAAKEHAEAEMIDSYLPAELSDEELAAIVDQAVADSGASTPQQIGLAMKSAIALVDGRADGGRVSELVKRALAG
ncbi:MAG: GatB/YqeY domain-containing protein [Solirubrobacteraceae bacterium]